MYNKKKPLRVHIELSNKCNAMCPQCGRNYIDKDGVLELLISNGENIKQPLNLFKANIKANFSYLRIRPVTKYNAPARGATVTLKSNLRTHAKTIDA